MIDSPLTNDLKDKVCTMDTEIRGEDVNNCQKQNGQCNGSYLNGTHQILEHKGIGGVLYHEGNCGEEKSSRVPCDGEIESDTIPKKRRHLEEMTFQDIYKEDYDDDDDDDEDSDWAPSQVVIEKWFCTNCTMVNDDDVLHCDVCGEYKDSEILRHGYFASDVAQEADHIPIESEVRDKYKDLSILKLGTDNRTAVGFDERMLLHSEMEMKSHPHPERPDRLRAIAASLSTAGIFPGRCIPVSAREIMKEELEMVHSLEHIEAVESTSTMLSSYFTSDTYANEHSACAARLAAGLCADLSSTIMAGDAKNGFALVRPPGHHAGVKDVMGFCLHNNAAVAALAAQRANAKKVLILDWDVHHGNGTQEIFEANKSVLYISMHRHEGGRFYPGTGAAVEVGSMGAEGYCVNIPWKCGGVGDNDYIFAFQHIVLPIALEFAPDFTIISAGFDAARGDPLGCCDVTPSGFARMTHLLSALSDGKLLVILEGGYNLRSISSSATAVIKVLLGETPECEPDVVLPTKAGLRTVMEVLQIQMKYWPKLEAHLTRLQSQWPSVSFESHKLVINKRTKREVIEKFAKLTRAQKQEKLPEVAHYFVKRGGRVVREKRRRYQKERARGLAVGESSGEVAMEKRKSNLVTREDRNLGRVGPKRPSGGAGVSGACGSSKRLEGGGGSSSSPLDLEVISFKPRERSSSLKRKADMSEQQAAKTAKAARHVLGDSSEVGGASGGERVGGKTTRSTRLRPAPLLDLETFGVGQSSLPAPREPSSSAKLKAPSIVSGKSIMADDDLERQVVYVDDQGVQRTVKRTDVSFKSSKIASCLLDHISLDGSRKELDTKGLADNLRQMDMALCLLVSGYQKLKEIALIAESEKESVTKLKEELQNVQDAYSVDREDFEALKKEHQGVCLAKLLMGTELEDAKLKLHAAEEKLDAANAEIVRVTGYAQHCKDVAQQAITAYDVLDADFLELEAEYKVFREEHECGAPSTTVLSVPGDACDAHVLPGTALEVVESQI